MGLIRVILALSVIGAHYHIQPSLGFAGPVVAVKFFYIISGFIFPQEGQLVILDEM